MARKYGLQSGPPINDFLLKNSVAEANLLTQILASSFLEIADIALKSNCIELADKYYRRVSKIPTDDARARRAQIGIDDVREKRRR
jgi:hypothetical protein